MMQRQSWAFYLDRWVWKEGQLRDEMSSLEGSDQDLVQSLAWTDSRLLDSVAVWESQTQLQLSSLGSTKVL